MIPHELMRNWNQKIKKNKFFVNYKASHDNNRIIILIYEPIMGGNYAHIQQQVVIIRRP